MTRYIDADEVKKAIEESWDGCLGSSDSHEITMNDLWVIDKVQTADVRKNVHAHWEEVDKYGNRRCSNCKSIEHVPTLMGKPIVWNFCPNCGAVMDERREDST